MDLLDRLMALQRRHGAVSNEQLRALAAETGTPLYRLQGLRSFYPVLRKMPAPARELKVCRDIVCALRGGGDMPAAVQAALGGAGDVAVTPVSCIGRCDAAPAALWGGTPLSGDAAALAGAALAAAAADAAPPPHAAPPAPAHWPTDPYATPGERYGVLRGVLAAGPSARDEVPATLKAAGLRGMGGAGFPTGSKWALTQRAPGATKYVVCNADESEPGTFKDRVILAQLPHLVLEAMAIAAWVVGAREGILYLRHEYAPEREALLAALDEARRLGVLGRGALEGQDFNVRLFVSPGGYIQGEETALLEALEDRRGEPRLKPPFPTTHGLWGRPTLINNVETFAAVPVILRRGADWWRSQGRHGAAGLKYIAVSGDVAQPGVHCVPLGTTAAELIERCGGMAGGAPLAAFMPGGVSSNFLPAARADVPMDFDALQHAGSMLGSGALIVVGAGRDLLALATNALRFFRNESCGKCVPCRLGTDKAVTLLDEALAGRPAPDLPARLAELGATLGQTSICGLGQVALQPVLSAIKQFPDQVAARLAPGKR